MENGEETALEQSRRMIFVDLLELLSLISKAHHVVRAIPARSITSSEHRALALVATRLDEAALWAQAVANVGDWPKSDWPHGEDGLPGRVALGEVQALDPNR